MEISAANPVEPMLAKAVSSIPPEGAMSYEPKWDGFRAIVYWDGETVSIGSRGGKWLTRYFPELVAEFFRQLPQPCAIDGEIIVRQGWSGAERLDWEALSQRIHPAESRIAKLSVETPAAFVAFDLLAVGDRSLLDTPFSERRAVLEALVAAVTPPLYLTQATGDRSTAERWLAEFEGAGLDGVVSKPLDGTYSPGKRVMFKTKHARTADVVLLGYRVHKSGRGVGSLLVGLYDTEGVMHNVGGASAFTDARRLQLIDELEPFVVRDDSGGSVAGATDRSRFSANRDASFVRLEPSRVLEVKYDQLEGARFRHSVQFSRWRPDREPRSCSFDQLEKVTGYDLAEVLG